VQKIFDMSKENEEFCRGLFLYLYTINAMNCTISTTPINSQILDKIKAIPTPFKARYGFIFNLFDI
ncbi:MAG: hypothetical protein ACTTKJ_09335, partial [Prevotella koreensis]|uniref:hypothetical protein n=1 Tax=Prevotella koreensis TaxID=2490854 RepID=UPI003F9F4DA8